MICLDLTNMTEQMMSLKAIESEMILRNIEFKFSEDYKAKSSSNVAYLPPILFFNGECDKNTNK